MRPLTLLVVGLVLAGLWGEAQAQRITGTRVSALPAVNYNSDEGFGYGVIGGVYGHGDGAVDPYYWAVEPLLFFTTNGRRELRVFGDLPYALGRRLRISGLALWDQDCCQPYYGLGSATTYEPALASPDVGPNYYTYLRERVTGLVDVQWRAIGPLRVLVGYAAHHMSASSRSPETRFAATKTPSGTSLTRRETAAWRRRSRNSATIASSVFAGGAAPGARRKSRNRQ